MTPHLLRRAPAAALASLLAVLLAATLFAPTAPGAQEGSPEGPPPAPVRVSRVVEREMTRRLQVPGSVVSRSTAALAAEVAGPLTEVAEAGDTVAAGDVVALVDDSAILLELRDADAQIRRLEANLEYLDQQVARLERLTAEQVVAASELEETASRRRAAREELEAARVARERSLFRLNRTKVRAPFGGRVVERLASPGSYVGVGTPIVQLLDTDDLEVRARAPISVEPYLAPGMEVTVSDGSRSVAGTVRALVPVGDETSRMFELRVALAEPAWITGAPVRVALPASAPRRVTAVPRDALVLRAEATYVFKVGEDDTAERVEVTPGIGDRELIEVVGEVAAGDRVIVRGAERLRPGQAVAVAGSS